MRHLTKLTLRNTGQNDEIRIDISNSARPDEIQPGVLKGAAEAISKSLAIIYENYKTGEVLEGGNRANMPPGNPKQNVS